MNKRVLVTIIATIVSSLIIAITTILSNDIGIIDTIMTLVGYLIVSVIIFFTFSNIPYSYYANAVSYTVLFTTYVFTVGLYVENGLESYASFPRPTLIPMYILVYFIISYFFQNAIRPKTSMGVINKKIIFYVLSLIINLGFMLFATVVIPSV